MNWLITGGSGFVGTYLLKELKLRPEKVVVYDRKKQQFPESENIVWEQGDVTNKDELLKVLEKHSIDGIIHLAFILLVRQISLRIIL